jgi:hypothetical protein
MYNYLSYFNLFESSTRHCIFIRNAFWHVHNCDILLSTHIEYTRFLSYQFINPKMSNYKPCMNQKHAAQANFPTNLILLKIETCADNINQKMTVSGSVTSWFYFRQQHRLHYRSLYMHSIRQFFFYKLLFTYFYFLNIKQETFLKVNIIF